MKDRGPGWEYSEKYRISIPGEVSDFKFSAVYQWNPEKGASDKIEPEKLFIHNEVVDIVRHNTNGKIVYLLSGQFANKFASIPEETFQELIRNGQRKKSKSLSLIYIG